MRALAPLDELPDDGDAGRAQQLGELAQVVVGVRRRGDAEGPLARALRGLGSVSLSPHTRRVPISATVACWNPSTRQV